MKIWLTPNAVNNASVKLLPDLVDKNKIIWYLGFIHQNTTLLKHTNILFVFTLLVSVQLCHHQIYRFKQI